jgi:catechol 2,3-dioxygenase-like lactoylglutathione lyase family enzyme
MRIKLTNVFVDDQESALRFYTDVLGFKKKQDFPVGQFKWLTVVSPEEPDGPELLLEPSDNPAARLYKESIYEQGITAAAFGVHDIQREYERLKRHGVDFKMEPTDVGSAKMGYVRDRCCWRIGWLQLERLF